MNATWLRRIEQSKREFERRISYLLIGINSDDSSFEFVWHLELGGWCVTVLFIPSSRSLHCLCLFLLVESGFQDCITFAMRMTHWRSSKCVDIHAVMRLGKIAAKQGCKGVGN